MLTTCNGRSADTSNGTDGRRTDSGGHAVPWTRHGGITGEEAALRRVATLVARGAPPDEVFAAVTMEAGRLLGAHHARMSRYDPDGSAQVGSTQEPLPAGTEARLAGFTDLAAIAIANAEAQAALTASRARVVAAADAARRRVERDLHDGAQQRLVSLGLQLRMAQTAPPGPGELVQWLGGVADELAEVLEELREIARGLHPAILAQGGLGPALKALARRSAVPVEMDVKVEGRLPEPVELAAYYMVAEALTNTAKHAHASVAEVQVATSGGALHVRVRDDGRGGAQFGLGSGLVGIRDRAEALGGRISLHSLPGAGTAVDITLPLGDPSGTSGETPWA